MDISPPLNEQLCCGTILFVDLLAALEKRGLRQSFLSALSLGPWYFGTGTNITRTFPLCIFIYHCVPVNK